MGTQPLRRERYLILGALGVLAVAAWAVLIWQARTTPGDMSGLAMGLSAPLFLAIWIAMMVAMMFPTAAPMIMMFARVSSEKRRHGKPYVPTSLFTGVYLLLWSAAGVLAYLFAEGFDTLTTRNMWLADNGGRVAGGLLVLAGLYQLTPFKGICLSKCRSPLAFVMTSWRDGYAGAVRMGVQHGLYCLGCCWLLFLILLPLGMMNIAAMAIITLLIFTEKSLPIGTRVVWAAGAALIVYGLAAVVHPGLLPVQVTQHPMGQM